MAITINEAETAYKEYITPIIERSEAKLDSELKKHFGKLQTGGSVITVLEEEYTPSFAQELTRRYAEGGWHCNVSEVMEDMYDKYEDEVSWQESRTRVEIRIPETQK